jgi:hypothetical protein
MPGVGDAMAGDAADSVVADAGERADDPGGGPPCPAAGPVADRR